MAEKVQGLRQWATGRTVKADQVFRISRVYRQSGINCSDSDGSWSVDFEVGRLMKIMLMLTPLVPNTRKTRMAV